MGCYDSSIFRPLLSGSNSNQNNDNQSNNNNQSNRGSRFRNRRKDYEGLNEDVVVDCGKYKSRNPLINLQSIMTALNKIGLLVWKNLLIRKRHYIVTALEIILPTLFALILVYGRSQATKGSSKNSQFFNSNAAGNLPKSFLPSTIFPEEFDTNEDLKINCGEGVYKSCVVAYAPKNAWTDEIINTMKLSNSDKNIEWIGFASESAIEAKLASLNLNSTTTGTQSFNLRAAIIFQDGQGTTDSSVSYKIRMLDTGFSGYFPKSIMMSIVPSLQEPGPDFSNRYIKSGFTSFQVNVDKALIKMLTNNGIFPSISIQPFPYPPYQGSLNFSDLYFIVIPNVLIIGFIFIVPSTIRGVVNERETGIKELMKLSGIPNWMHWFAWMINSMLFLTISVTIVVGLFFMEFLNPEAGPIISHSSFMVWWIVLILYMFSSVSFLFFISSFFQRPTIAITVGIILWLTTYYIPSIQLGDNNKYLNLGLTEKMSAALLPNMAFYWALKVMCSFEGRGIGARFSNLFQPLSSVDDMTLGHVMIMFIIDTILYLLLTLYIEAVLPSQYGIRKPWYFIFKPLFPSYWKERRVSFSSDDFNTEFDTGNKQGQGGFQSEPDGLKIGVEIRNMKKLFGRNKSAVSGVSLKMYDGEIFALLGHNGAGKTTTISCCIGMIAPSSGTAIINGYDIRTDMDEVRQHLGLCPQHNLIFDELTVSEHLVFFARMKGLTLPEAQEDCKEMLQKLQLTEKINTLAKALSGGQKRKLCLGISLIGRAKVVFLDEPTSGMDVEARRAIWDLLLKERGHRTIILTTHFMEEADVLGDRIGIMANGKVQCCGTSLFLKKFYGTGYTLSLTTTDDITSNDILKIVQKLLPTAELKEVPSKTKFPCEWSIVIPSESCSTSLFPAMFKDLQLNKDTLGIINIGLSLTTMDEVFVKAGEQQHNDENHVPSSVTNSNGSSHELTNLAATSETTYNNSNAVTQKLVRLEGVKLLYQQFLGLLLKRYSYTLRKWILFLTQLAIPVLILILAITAGNSGLNPPTAPKALTIDMSPYKNPITIYSTSDNNLENSFKATVGSSVKEFIPSNSTDNLVNELIRIGVDDLASFRERHIIAAEMNSTHFKTMYSTIPYHASPLAVNLASNTFLQYMNKSSMKISVTNHPLQEGYEYIFQALETDPAFSITNALMFGALAPIGLALLAASFLVAPVEERLCNGKQLQLMTGVNPIIYWGSSFVWDYFVMAIVVAVMVLCFPIFQTENAYTSYGGGGVIFLVLLTYGYSAIPFSYLCSLFAGTVPGGFSLVVILHIATGMLIPFVVYILESTLSLMSIASRIRLFGRFFPTFGASMNTMRFVEIALKNSRCNFLPINTKELLCNPEIQLDLKYRQCCSNCVADFPGASCFQPIPYLSWTYKTSTGSEVPGIGQEILCMLLLGILYQVLLILIEYGFIQRLVGMVFKTNTEAFQNNPDDEDVLLEAERVNDLVKTGKMNEDALVVENFCKSYGSFAAVSNLSFGVHHGECFGLLGVNGAGKTTTFRMLTGDELRSNGNAYSMNCSLDTQRKRFLGNIGYCPQFDGLIDVLTGSEMVALFGRLRGVKSISKESQKWLKRVGLTESANVQCKNYSGGMKRRLSAAMAMIGDPEIVLLDEPTSGVDPISRREFWKIISSIKESGRAIILTSHSMDEISACCSRLGIMVNGQMQCMGSVQYLKNKFAQGYTLAIKLKPNIPQESEDVITLEKYIMESFSPCTQKDKHQTALQYHIQNASFPWDILFQTMENLKMQFPEVIEEYSITETSLEEVFLAFARTQYPPRQADIPIWKKLLICQTC